jgi:hypothetical protein
LGTQAQFEDAVRLVIETVSFSQDNKVQVFELNIRALGGLVIHEKQVYIGSTCTYIYIYKTEYSLVHIY